MAVVVPGRGKAAETAKLLLELADSPYQVQTSTEFGGDLGVAYLIPDELHNKYLDAVSANEVEEVSEPVKRRPGRPRKAVAATETEEE